MLMGRRFVIIFTVWLVNPALAAPTLETLLQKLEERDALIRDLQLRVETLERQVSELSAKETAEKRPLAETPRSAAPPPHQTKPPAPGQFEVDDKVIPGSEQVIGGLTLDASSILGRGILLDVSSRIGLTEEAPDYTVRMSVGKRFNVLPTSNTLPLRDASFTEK